MPGEPECILRDMSDGVVVIDEKGRLKTLNPAARALLGLGESDGALPQSFAALFIGDSRNDGFVQAMLDALQTADAPGERVVDFYPKSGQTQKRRVNVKASFLRGGDGAEKTLIAVLSDVTERENAIVFRKDVTILVAIAVMLICAFVFIYRLLSDYWPGRISPSAMTYGLEAALLLLSVVIVKTTSLRPRIVFRGEAARKAMLSGALISLAAAAALIAIKYILLQTGATLFRPGEPFFHFERFTAKELYQYLPCVLVQEFLARSILQEGYIYVFGEKYGVLAVVVSSFMFGTVHLPYSFVMMAGAALLLGALGLFYQKNRNLIAVTTVHFVVTEAAMILGFL